MPRACRQRRCLFAGAATGRRISVAIWKNRSAARIYDADIIGQAILGVIHQTSSEGHRSGRKRRDVIDNVTRFLVRALKP
ncbi:MAG: hypothetical protein WDM89_12845 [Rhizomicrobium sp.]